MQCPNCKSTLSRVIKTETYFVKIKVRVRECRSCFHTWRTKEENVWDETKQFTVSQINLFGETNLISK